MKKLFITTVITALAYGLYAQPSHYVANSPYTYHRFYPSSTASYIQFNFANEQTNGVDIQTNLYEGFNFNQVVKAPSINIINSYSGARAFAIMNNSVTNFSIYADGSASFGASYPVSTFVDIVGKVGYSGGRNFKVTYYGGGQLANTEFSALTNTTLAGGNNWTALYAKQGSANKAGVFEGDVSIFGHVGIGTTTVDNNYGWGRILDIYESRHAKLLVRNSTVKTGVFSHDATWMGTAAGVVGTESNHELILMANYGNRVMTLKTNGNVGVGISNPSDKLHVANGSLRLGAPVAGIISDVIRFGDGDYVKIGEFEKDDRLSFYALQGYSFTGGNVGIGLSSTTVPAYKLDVNGKVRADNVSVTSDERLKTEIRAISNEKDRLYLLQGKFYIKTLRPTDIIIEEEQVIIIEDSISEQKKNSRQKQITEFSEYGYLAQELEKVFPDLVSQDGEGYYAVNYIGLIPIIVEALKDQREENIQQQKELKVLQDVVFSQEKDLNEMQNKMEDMQKIVMNCCENTNNNHKSNNENNDNKNTQSQIRKDAVLYQNVPNPFSSNTEISCDIPASFNSAVIYVYNLQGAELMSFPIKQTGINTVTVSASVLPAGMYLYTLVVDNIIIDTKRMILTK